MNTSIRNLALVSTVILSSTMMSCNGTQVGALVGGVIGATVGAATGGTAGAIEGGAFGAIFGAVEGTLLTDPDAIRYYYYDETYHERRYYEVEHTYEVREWRYVKETPNGYTYEDTTEVITYYHREVPVRRWYDRDHRCQAQWYVVGVYDSIKAQGLLDQLDPTDSENVTRSAKNWGLPVQTSERLLGKVYLSVQESKPDAFIQVFAADFSGRKAQGQLIDTLSGKTAVSDSLADKVAHSLSTLGEEKVSTADARMFIEATAAYTKR
jgi:hypothetical protein